MTRATLAERFWAKVDKSGECWLWTASLHPDGYGHFNVGGHKIVNAHRVAYKIEHGLIPDGMVIDHICHNRACVRPQHLRAVTHKENHENRAGADSDSKSGVRGVYWRKDRGMWQGSVKHHGKRFHAGYFDDLADADKAVTALRLELFTSIISDTAAA